MPLYIEAIRAALRDALLEEEAFIESQLTQSPAKTGAKLRPLLALAPYILRYRGRALLAFISLTIAAITTLVVPVAVRRMIDFGFTPEGIAMINSYFGVMVALRGTQIVEVALELHVRDRKPLLESAVEAARARFRPILMTSFAFILGVVPLVLATGAGANARKSIGITVFSGMLASTCLAVLFVPTFFVVIQRFENWLKERKRKKAGAQVIPQTGP